MWLYQRTKDKRLEAQMGVAYFSHSIKRFFYYQTSTRPVFHSDSLHVQIGAKRLAPPPDVRDVGHPLQVPGDGVETDKEPREQEDRDGCDRTDKSRHLEENKHTGESVTSQPGRLMSRRWVSVSQPAARWRRLQSAGPDSEPPERSGPPETGRGRSVRRQEAERSSSTQYCSTPQGTQPGHMEPRAWCHQTWTGTSLVFSAGPSWFSSCSTDFHCSNGCNWCNWETGPLSLYQWVVYALLLKTPLTPVLPRDT